MTNMAERREALISIIVPVYNVENYLKRCVASLINQTYTNLEIILVDDGSTDASGEMCDVFAIEDQRIKVIHKKNGGLSDARNKALDMMTGDYVCLIDSDDWVSIYYAENLYKALIRDSSDMARCCEEEVYEGGITSTPTSSLQDYHCYNSKEYLKKVLYQDGTDTHISGGGLYSARLFDNLRFPFGELYEDILITYEVIKRSNRIATISNMDSYYFQRDGSIQYCSFTPPKMDGVKHFDELCKYVEVDFPELVRASICRRFNMHCNIIFQIANGEYEKEQRYLWKEIVKYRNNVLTNKEARMKARLAAILSYFGYSCMKQIYLKTQSRAQMRKIHKGEKC